MNRIMCYANIADNFVIKKLLHAVRKTTHSQDKRLPITVPILKALPGALSKTVVSQYETTMYKAMFFSAFFALLRVGELTSTQFGSANILQLSHIQLPNTQNEPTHIIINMQNHKHAQGTPMPITMTTQKDISICPVKALINYLRLRGTQPGPLFILHDGRSVPSYVFTTTLKECIATMGLDPQQYTSHSFRIGGASFAHQHNFSDIQLQRLGWWKSSAYRRYIRCPTLTPSVTHPKFQSQ